MEDSLFQSMTVMHIFSINCDRIILYSLAQWAKQILTIFSTASSICARSKVQNKLKKTCSFFLKHAKEKKQLNFQVPHDITASAVTPNKCQCSFNDKTTTKGKLCKSSDENRNSWSAQGRHLVNVSTAFITW